MLFLWTYLCSQTQELIVKASDIIENKLVAQFDLASKEFEASGNILHRDIMRVHCIRIILNRRSIERYLMLLLSFVGWLSFTQRCAQTLFKFNGQPVTTRYLYNAMQRITPYVHAVILYNDLMPEHSQSRFALFHAGRAGLILFSHFSCISLLGLSTLLFCVDDCRLDELKELQGQITLVEFEKMLQQV